MAARITLSKKHLATEAGNDLLALLMHVTADGEMSLGDVKSMREWLDSHRDSVDVPAIAWLHELVGLILADGRVTADERVDLLLAIERVLPADERILAKKRRQVADQLTSSDAEPPKTGKDRPATENQIAYLQALGATNTDGLTVASASAMIDNLVGRRGESPSNRQVMVLRFWNRLDLGNAGLAGTSEWMDAFYAEDQDRRAAWELWKQENPKCQTGQGDPTLVPIGAGEEFLRRVKAGKKRGSSVWAFLAIVIIVTLGAWAMLKFGGDP